MEAGNQLDALVAEKVMGYVPLPLKVEDDPTSLWTDQGLRDGLIASGFTHYPPPGSPQKVCGIPPFSTDIKAAWRVVEKLASEGIRLWVGPSVACTNYGCEIVHDAGRDEDDADYTFCPTAPEAICFAALKAVGEDKVRQLCGCIGTCKGHEESEKERGSE